MTEPVIFAVERHAGREIPAIYRDYALPERLTRKIPRLPDGTPAEPGLLVYALRLDKLPNGEELAAKPIAELYALFVHLRKTGALPPGNLVDPPVKAEGRKGMIVGDWWKPPARTWEDRPADPYPEPDAIAPRHDAPAFVGQRGGYLGVERP